MNFPTFLKFDKIDIQEVCSTDSSQITFSSASNFVKNCAFSSISATSATFNSISTSGLLQIANGINIIGGLNADTIVSSIATGLGLSITSNASIGGALSVLGTSTLSILSAGASSLSSLSVTGASTLSSVSSNSLNSTTITSTNQTTDFLTANKSTNLLADLSVATTTTCKGIIYSNAGVILPTTGGSSNLLDYYEVALVKMTFTGAYTVTVDAWVTRIGSFILWNVPGSSSTVLLSSGSFTANLPTRFFPKMPLSLPASVISSGNTTSGTININSNNLSISNGSILLGTAGWKALT